MELDIEKIILELSKVENVTSIELDWKDFSNGALSYSTTNGVRPILKVTFYQ